MVWRYYISYSGFVFRKRVGTLLTELELNNIVASEYMFAYIIHVF